MSFRHLYNGYYSPGIKADGASNIVIKHSYFIDVGWGIYITSGKGSQGWYVSDSIFEGDNADYSYQNVRVWGNRLTSIGNHPFSFQAENMGPWYFVRNQVEGWGANLFKLKCGEAIPEDNFFIHNTFIGWNNFGANDANCNQYYVRNFARNNIVYSLQGANDLSYHQSPGSKTWQSNIDFDAFPSNSMQTSALKSVSEIVIDQSCFNASFDGVYETPYNNDGNYGPQFRIHTIRDYPLNNSCIAVDTGAVLPNVNDPYVVDEHPDRGALELGMPVPHYGPRP